MKLLFICTHNRCRSILAEALSRSVFPESADIRSAGSSPAGEVFPGTLNYLKAQGLSVEGLISQSWDDHDAFAPDLVVTVCDNAAGETCPVWMDKTARVHWPLPDPSKETDPVQQRLQFERLGAMMKQRLEALAASMQAGSQSEPLAQLADQILNAEQAL